MAAPNISLISAVKNESKYIISCVDSILSQVETSWFDYDVIIVDDHSNDETFELLRSAYYMDDRVCCVRSPGSGKCCAYNNAFSICSGDFIFIFGGDDLLPANSLSLRLLSMIEYCDTNSIDWKTVPVAQFSKMRTLSENISLNNKVLPPAHIPLGNTSGATTMLNRQAAELIFPIPEMLHSEDGWTSLCIDNFTKSYHLPLVTYIYRIHPNNSVPYSRGFTEYRLYLLERLRVYEVFARQRGKSLDNAQASKLNNYVNLFKFFEEKDILAIARSRVALTLKIKCLAFSSKIIYFVVHLCYRLRIVTL